MTRPTKARAWSSLLFIALSLTFTGCAAIPAAGGAAGTAGAAGAATGFTGLLGQICQNIEACKAKFCASPCGQLFSQGMSPLKCLTGGSFGNCCPTTPTAAQQAQPGAAGAAAQIQADTAAAKARVASVEYLGTVDCHYWPEAEKTLIDSLRADRNECVRFAAARVMGSGCCCTNKTIAALTLSASAEDTDGNPSENSLRVRAAAAAALSRCAMAPPEPIKPRPPERPDPIQPELPPAIPLERIDPAVGRTEFYYQTAERTPRAALVARARQAIAQASSASQASETATGMPPLGGQSLFDIVSHAQAPKPSATPDGPARDVDVPNFAQAPKPPATPTATPRTVARSQPAPAVAAAPTGGVASDQPAKAKTLKDLFIQSTGAR
ncbi:hypothetical protein SAMN05444166_6466 [Singulisphaera sp. GP187]|uniref:hypothetical protein n=1 Tax=Singulisphaera sp. GP187 TaxID=1882752 RepID=UPI000928F67E|nr:hypothetical protein [Singulisphaera sp. GP187]SIO60628.1 hypothetical protein SAMN05444166_6466 [Singulisphaera sp. GP187]